MARIKFLIFFFISFLTTFFFHNARGNNQEVDDMELKINLNRAIYYVGDDVEISFLLKNNMSRIIKILNQPHPYAVNHIKMFDSKNILQETELTIKYMLSLAEEKNLVSINQDEGIKFVLKGNIKKCKDNSVCMDFQSSRVILNKVNEKYTMVGQVKSDPQMYKIMDKKIISQIWFGEVVSNKIVFEIIE